MNAIILTGSLGIRVHKGMPDTEALKQGIAEAYRNAKFKYFFSYTWNP